MNIFKLINQAVQNVAKFMAFAIAFLFTFIAWGIYKINEFIMLGLAGLVCLLHLIAQAINWFMVTCIMIPPAKVAEWAFMFALDISKEERADHLEAALKQLQERHEADRQEQVLRGFRKKAKTDVDKAEEYFQKIADEETDNDPS